MMPVRFIRVRYLSMVFTAMLVLGACTVLSEGPEQQVTSLMNVAPDKALIVGRLELHPPLQEGEQDLKTSEAREFRNVFVLYGGDQLRDFKTDRPDSFAGSFSLVLEKEFFIKVDKGRIFYISGGMFYTAYDPPIRTESHIFSTPFRIDVKPDDQAVYIGTIQLFRDKNNKLKSISVRDDYEWAVSRFKERFGTSRTLRKALVDAVGLFQ